MDRIDNSQHFASIHLCFVSATYFARRQATKLFELFVNRGANRPAEVVSVHVCRRAALPASPPAARRETQRKP